MEQNNLQTQPPIDTEPKPARPWLKIVLFSFLGVLLAAGLVFAVLKIGVSTKPQERVCTTEAKICPDGSAVGRTGPNCEFAPCPTQAIQDETANWKTYTNTNYDFSFKYPSEWNINVPSFEGKHENNKTLLRVDVTSSLDFKNAALLGNKKDILNVSISLWDNENAKSFESVLAEWDNFFQNPKPNSTSINEISQIKWTRRELINASNLPIIEFVTLKGKYFYVAVVSPQDSTLIDFAGLILSTFKFLE